MNHTRLVLIAAIICCLTFSSGDGYGQSQSSTQLLEVNPTELPQRLPTTGENTRTQQARQQLQQLQGLIIEKRDQIAVARQQLASETDNTRVQELQAMITQEENDLNNLRRSFENIALGGIDLGIFNTDEQNVKFDWQQELQLIVKPVFQKLKEMTEKPRQIERLKSQLTLLESQRRTAQRAQDNVVLLQDDSIDEATRLRLETLRQTWARQLNDIKREVDINQLQLNLLVNDDETLLNKVRNSMKDFFTGTGLNLALSIAAFFLTMLLMKGLYMFYNRVIRRGATHISTGSKMLAYGYQALTLLMSFAVTLMVLYMIGDMLLMALALILLVLLLLGLRNYLPRFIDETKLLLNIGAVREHERVIYQGLPWLVRSLGVYTHLYNPALEGLLRLPLKVVLGMVSRPCKDDEPWFPTQTGDWVMLSNGTVGQVLRQTPEVVQLKARRSVQNYVTTDFIANEPQILSNGFNVWISFGLDYQHQSIATTKIPDVLQKAITAGIKEWEQARYVENVTVEFLEAGVSSLNYFVNIIMNGAAAESYFELSRLLQRICVDTCNQQGWVIPFNQVTVHTGSSVGGIAKQWGPG